MFSIAHTRAQDPLRRAAFKESLSIGIQGRMHRDQTPHGGN